jgi:kynurenine 3-monooxygenase
VSFSNEGYADIVRKSERQGKILVRTFLGLLLSPLVVGGVAFGCHVWKALRAYSTLKRSGWR